ncbi:cyclopropane fatty acyl phospholipid synthase [Lacimicrobium alkaliphilum]|uniref:Cyclopropane-fatty-acyl-phospholipid synthase n=1 Tax=Lacimicrobium alkaliphilum TaxID=1526571 RepID=A0A0U2Z238_9ALTE|nr:cyclopropane fatty acyl phospholipid synthase [Lacimicrobium alkaliphilum]ALS96963.1 cyclopropane-fatty-acyl-phospholipid synthase [Lacimicrobium alkaliphilum]
MSEETAGTDNKLDKYSSVPHGTAKEVPSWLEHLLSSTGITVNGSNPWDPQIHDHRFYRRVLQEGSLGAGESYMDGWWDCARLDEFFTRLMSRHLEKEITGKWVAVKHWMMARLVNLQSVSRAFQVGEQHYDVGNDLYQAMLDPTMCYSCGYWHQAQDLHQAQRQKLDLVCRKMDLQPGDRVLDIGCGWGSFAEFAARQYQASVTGVTISKEQQKLATDRCEGLPVDIRLQDYRSLQGQFDKLVSIGMFEHVGQKNYDTYFQKARELMEDEGIFVLHTIGKMESRLGTDPWIHKYIFPNGAIPSLAQISKACEPYFVVEDVHNFGPDYDHTLMGWLDNFRAAWPQLKHQYNERFYRMWTYYLQCCAGAFRSRNLQLFQVVLRKPGSGLSRYHSPR